MIDDQNRDKEYKNQQQIVSKMLKIVHIVQKCPWINW